MTAFNYETQAWEQGAAARETRLEQVERELDMLAGPDGPAYAAKLGVNQDDTLARLKAELLALL